MRARFAGIVASVVTLGAVSAIPVHAAPTPPATPNGATPGLAVQGSVEELAVSGAGASARATLVDKSGHTVATKKVDEAGTALFEQVPPGSGYVVRVESNGHTRTTKPAKVLSPDKPPPDSFYATEHLAPGLNYFKTRDGTLLAAMVRLPGPPEAGPYPTVLEYSGYDVANPDKAQPSTIVAGALQYATVGVNVRGTGCSGGAFDIFEPLESLDGYDAIETIAAQPWVAHGKVGMVGISYPGIMQLFVAGTRPPHLAAISPLSVIDDVYRATLYPGGILNNGFAASWAKERQAQAKPAGQAWAKKRIEQGDETCKANQTLRGQNHDLLKEIRENRYYDAKRGDPLAPYTFVDRINVPVFLAGAWQDEQTGGHFPDMLDRFTHAPIVRFSLTNGTHADSLGPAIITRLGEFLDFYVARRTPRIDPGVRGLAPTLYSVLMGVNGVELPPDRFAGMDYQTALHQYEAESPVRILFDNGGGGTPGAPVPAFETGFPKWPPPGAKPQRWYFGPDHTLTSAKPKAKDGNDSYRYDPSARPATDLAGDAVEDAWKALPPYNWQPLADGKAVAYVSDPLPSDTVVAGSGSVDLWIEADVPDVDLQVTLTEVRPDGKETYVQSGWLRASHRKLDTHDSTELRPRQTHTERDAKPLPHGQFAAARVELFPVGHVFRAGSRVRISVEAPGGDRPRWTFDAIKPDTAATVRVARSASGPSSIVLPVVSSVAVPAPLPPCPALRAQPCRDYVPLA